MHIIYIWMKIGVGARLIKYYLYGVCCVVSYVNERVCVCVYGRFGFDK